MSLHTHSTQARGARRLRRWARAVSAGPLLGALVLGSVWAPASGAQIPSGTWQLRICYSDKLKRSDASLAASEGQTYSVSFSSAGEGSLTGRASFPGGLTMTGTVSGSTWRVRNWYVGNDPATRTKSRGTAILELGDGVVTGSWSTIKGNTGTWVFSSGTPGACPTTAGKSTGKSTTSKVVPKTGGPVRVRVQTAPTQVAGVVVSLGGKSVTTIAGEVFADVPSGALTISASGPEQVLSILIRSTGGDALGNDGSGAHCTGSTARLTLDPSTGQGQKQDYIVIIGLSGSTQPRGPCNGNRINAPRNTGTSSGPQNLKRFDATVVFAGTPFLSPNCGVIASQHIDVTIHGGVFDGGSAGDPFYGGGNISELAPREIVPGSPTAPPDCDSNGFVFWAIDGDFSVARLPSGTVRTLVLRVWVAGGGDRSRPQQCQTPVGERRLVGTITLIDSDEFLRPQNITADAIEFGPFGAGCTAHDRAFSNTAFVSGIGWISKANVELSCELPGQGLSPKNC